MCRLLLLRKSRRAPAFSRERYRIPYTQFRLDNGLRVVVHEDHSTPIVAVNLNSSGDGGVVVFTGDARLSPEDGDMSTNPRYVDKYRSLIEGELATSVEAAATAYRVAIRVAPGSLRAW